MTALLLEPTIMAREEEIMRRKPGSNHSPGLKIKVLLEAVRGE